VALLFLLGPLGGCASRPDAESSPRGIWMTYARNAPHATAQRVDMFLATDEPAIVVVGFPQQFVTISVHEATTGRLLTQSTQYVEMSAGKAFLLNKRLPPGHYTVRASQDGAPKAESSFIVR
jgi:hypothetical protein